MPDRASAELGRRARQPHLLDKLGFGLKCPRKPWPPILVLGAADDAIFRSPAAEVTARADWTEAKLLPGIAHDMMLDTRWRDTADAIASWLADRP
jgi:alpha-beta hydrolase superfamily lysophospholipase